MGVRGTAAAKEVADVVLKDDSFTSIVVAIREGRIIFENIRKFLMFLLSSNLSEILVLAILFVSNSPLAIVPLQILFINLLSDVFPALALGLSSGSERIMEHPPRHPEQPVLSNRQWMSVIIYALVIAVSTFGSAMSIYGGIDDPQSFREASTVLFYTLILSQVIHVFNVSDHNVVFYKSDVFKNKYVWAGAITSLLLAIIVYFLPPVKEVLHISDINGYSLLMIITFSIGSFLMIQFLKKMNLVH
jgi:Ca2+-transporting ATPase